MAFDPRPLGPLRGPPLAASAALALGLLAGCGAPGLRRFPPRAPLQVDDDQRPFRRKPAEAYGTLEWDFVDQTIARPLVQSLRFEPGGEATNVNSLDEVPDSSWFTNRIGRRDAGRALTPAQAALGPCAGEAPLDPDQGPWLVVGAKPNGANPGFMIKAPDGRKYLIKFDDRRQPERASTADVVGSLAYHAAGFFAPCNRVVYFRREVLRVGPGAKAEEPGGVKVPLTDEHLASIFARLTTAVDGRVRAGASLLLAGSPVGPWNYYGARGDDPNDVVPHEDRRELRGSRLLAAWLGHEDARQQNTLAVWVDAPAGGGFLRHAFIDFGDCLGNFWSSYAIARRTGHQYHLDLGDALRDYVTLGIPTRPWDVAHFGPSGPVFGYYGIDSFEPEAWHPSTPNPAFGRMTERDGAWMARVLARFTDAHLAAMVEQARLSRPELSAELVRLLRGRRDKVLARYLGRLAPLSEPSVREGGRGAELCLRDVAVEAGVARAEGRSYRVRAWAEGNAPLAAGPAQVTAPGSVCVPLPASAAGNERYVIVDVAIAPGAPPARVHLYALGKGAYRVAGLERPADDAPPW
ncbi:MAG: hypothetical protein MUF34_26085 [Polyangiaceae bacterium]|nr:hypothetical protein [Polyangiaceae bacterium]